MIGSLVLIIFWMFVVPLILGFGMLKLDKNENVNICLALILGIFVELLVFSALAIPMTFLKCTFVFLKNLWTILILIAVIISIVLNRNNFKHIIRKNIEEFKVLPKGLTIIFLILIIIQCYFPFKYMHEDYDDSNFVAKAVIAVDTNSLFVYDDAGYEYEDFPTRTVFSQFPHYIGVISVLSNIHPTVFAHTILPVVFIIIVYSFYYVFGKSLFKNDLQKTMIFVNLLAIIYIFGDYSRYTNFVRLLYRTWQGKSLVANLTIPFVWYVFIEYIGKQNSKFGWIILGLGCLGSITFSSMAFILPPIMVVILVFLYAIKNNKKSYFIILGGLFFLAIVAIIIILGLDNQIAYNAILKDEKMLLGEKIDILIQGINTKENLNLVREAYDRAGGGKYFFSIFTIAILFIILNPENKEVFFSFAIYSIIVIIINFNPIISRMWSWIFGAALYWRMYWLLPIGYAVAYMFTDIIGKEKNAKMIIVLEIIVVLILILNGKCIFTKLNYVESDNYYKIPDHLLEILFTIQADDEKTKKVAGPEEVLVYARQVDGNVIIETIRDVEGYYRDNTLVKNISINNIERIKDIINNNNYNYNYIVMYTSFLNDKDVFEDCGFEEICKNDTYVLYKLTN